MKDRTAPSILKILLVRLRFLLAFLTIGLLVAKWDYILNLTDRLTRPSSTAEKLAGDVEWFCPMHPSVVRAEPGNCPICGMPLSQRKRGAIAKPPEGVLSRLQLSPYRIRQAGLATEEIRYRPLVRDVRTVGFIAYDERRLTDLSARIAGRVDELFVNFEGDRVKANEPVYKIYSPDLVTTQEEYLLAMKTLDEISQVDQHDKEVGARATRLAEAARQRLRLWGISDAQVAEIERTRKAQTHLVIHSPVSGVVYKKDIHAGHYVEVGQDPFTIADDSTVWMQAEVFERELGLITVGQLVEIESEAYPGKPFHGAVAYIQPSLQAETRTAKVRVDIDNENGSLKPGMYVSAIVRVPLGKVEEIAARSQPAAAERTAYVCEMHKDFALEQPGVCERCGGMKLEEMKIPVGSKLVFACPDHPDVSSDKPGKCPRDGKALEWKVITEPTQIVEQWMCPAHPDHTSAEKTTCPEDGREMKLYRRENPLAAPFSAVIDSGFRKTVFIARDAETFDAVEVTLGTRAGEYYQVLGGLKPGDRVVTAGAFLLDAAARLNPSAGVSFFGASGHEGHGSHR
jgi:Cu(I)/Ag(I) efflux system membrane fusion protein